MNKLICLLLAPVALFAQDAAVKFATTTTTNASQFGVGFVVGFQFTVSQPITVTALGAVLGDAPRDAPLKPVFGALPTSMQVGLWEPTDRALQLRAGQGHRAEAGRPLHHRRSGGGRPVCLIGCVRSVDWS